MRLFFCMVFTLHLFSGMASAPNLDMQANTSSGRKFTRMLFGHGLPKNGNRWPFARGAMWVSVATGMKLNVYPDFGTVSNLPLMLATDYSYNDHFALGIYGGYYAPTYSDVYGNSSYQSKMQSFVGGARLTFHFCDLFNRSFLEVLNTRKWDLYATAHAGIVYYKWEVASGYRHIRDFSPTSFFTGGLVAGIRYMPLPRVAFYAEAGKGIFGYYGFGASFKIMK